MMTQFTGNFSKVPRQRCFGVFNYRGSVKKWGLIRYNVGSGTICDDILGANGFCLCSLLSINCSFINESMYRSFNLFTVIGKSQSVWGQKIQLSPKYVTGPKISCFRKGVTSHGRGQTLPRALLLMLARALSLLFVDCEVSYLTVANWVFART